MQKALEGVVAGDGMRMGLYKILAYISRTDGNDRIRVIV